jgi:HEAT repeat protein
MDQSQRQLLEKVLRRLHAGVKTFQLYSPTHASAQATAVDVTATLRGYLQRYGSIGLQVNKDKLLVDGVTLTEGTMDSMAYFFYVRNLASVAILAGVDDGEVAALLRILSQERQVIDASGGVEALVLSQDLPHIIVKAMMLRESLDALSEAGIVEALIRTRRLSPEQRDAVFSMLRRGPSATATMLVSVHRAASGPSRADGQIDVDALLTTLETLDRSILDEPVEDQEALLQNLSQGVLQLDEPLRAALAPELVSQAVDGGSGRAILSELTGQEIALLILGPVGQTEVAAGLGRFLADLRVPEQKAADVAAFLETALAAHGTKLGALAALPGLGTDQAETGAWAAIDPALLTFGPRDEAALEVLRREVSEQAVTRDAIKGLINLLTLQERPEEIAETAKALAAHLTFLADSQEYDILSIALQSVQEARTRADTMRASIDAELSRVLDRGLLARLVRDALQRRADVSDDVWQALVAVRELAVPHLVRLLEREPEAAQRGQLCTLMAGIYAGRADLLGSSLPGASWHLARNLAFVLGELHEPAAVSYLTPLASHAEYRVRREALEALRKIPSEQARVALIQFLHDPDPRIQYSLIGGGDVPNDPQVIAWMQQVVRSPQWTPDVVSVKVAALKTLARMRPAEAIPVVRRVARARWVFGQGRRTVRDAARQLLDTLERSVPRSA